VVRGSSSIGDAKGSVRCALCVCECKANSIKLSEPKKKLR